VQVKRKQRFEEISLARFDLVASFNEPEYDIKTVRRAANLGTDLPTLLDEIDRWPI